MVQVGREPADFKPLPTVGPGAYEIRIRDAAGAFRVVYVAKFEEAVYVLHAFQKKTRICSRRTSKWQCSVTGQSESGHEEETSTASEARKQCVP